MINKYYPWEVWLTSLVLAPIFFIFLSIIIGGSFSGDSDMPLLFIFFIIYGILMSFPSFLLFLFCCYNIKEKSVAVTKIILCLIAVSSMLVTVFLFWGKDSYDFDGNFGGFTMSAIYTVSIIISSFAYKYGSRA